MKKYVPIVLTAVVAVLVTACSDPKAANEKNFKIAIQKRLDATYPKCYITKNFPATIPSFFDSETKPIFKALVSAGLLSVKEEPRMTTDLMFNKVVVQPVYSLTEEGKKAYKADAAKNFAGTITGGFCFGKATVKEISEFTEPADALGVRASRVQYTYEVSDFPAWAKLPETIAAIAQLRTDADSVKTPIKGFDMLVLTNNGWVSQLGGMLR